MKRLRGVQSLVHDAVDSTVDLVEVGHESTSRALVRVFTRAGLGVAARQVDGVRRLFTSGVLASVKGVNHLVKAVADVGLDHYAPASTDELPIPLRSDVIGTAAWLADAALGAANGVVGDHIAHRGNGLDLGMALRGLEAWIEPDGKGIPADASPRLVVLVHGLAATEWSWCYEAERHLGDPAANFGTLIQADFGHTPIFARYNTGRHVSESGRALAQRLEALVATWPRAVEDIVLIGHSMGGLVVRSACHIAHTEGQAWIGRVRRIVTLSAPLQGTPLEKFGNFATSVLAAVDLPGTMIPARVINGRSAGIKDLRYGYVQDAEWQGYDPDALGENHRQDVDLPADIAWCFLSATVGATAGHPMSQALGDLLVRVESASGPVDAPTVVTTHHVGGMNHAAVQVHPAVYAHIRTFLGGAQTSSIAAPTSVV